MFKPLEFCIGLRYTRAKRRNHFISFISLTSTLGVAVGVAALITVLSVMNGFEKEIKERILGMTAHASALGDDAPLNDWRALGDGIAQQPRVSGVAPFVRGEAMLTNRGAVQGVLVEGILPDEEPKVSVVGQKMIEGQFSDLSAGAYRIVLGAGLAQALQAMPGDKITVVSPQTNATPAGILPRLKQFTVSGIFEVGMSEYDNKIALIHMADAARLFRTGTAVTGLRLKLDDVMAARQIGTQIRAAVPGRYHIVDWTEEHVNFFQALATEKTVMFIILMLIVTVAAFNIVATLVMVVADKEADIAILRTLGLSPGSVMSIFVVQGAIIGLVGTLAGMGGGVWLALNVPTVVPFVENLLNIKLLAPDIYYVSELPSDMRWPDVTRITLVAFLLCMLATLYPSWRASRTQPAEALRYE